jgi:hypothetical protein
MFKTSFTTMRSTILSGFLFFLASAGQAQTADEIITKHLEAMGGKAWDTIRTVVTEAKVTVEQAPGMDIPMTMTVVNSKSARIDVTVMGMTQSQCINGDKGWANNPFQGKADAEPLTADQVKEMKEITDVSGPLYNYKAKGYTVEYVGKDDLEGTEVQKIKVVLSPTQTQYFLIDPKTGYELKNISVTTVDGKEQKSESTFSNFKKVGTVTFPHTIEQNNPNMGNMVTTITNVKLNTKVDPNFFEIPAKK